MNNPINTLDGVDNKMGEPNTVNNGMTTDADRCEKELAKLNKLMNAVSRSYAMIEFDPAGNVIDANDNILSAFGYTLGEVKGKHHRMFVEPEYAASSEYRQFWERLNRGDAVASEFKRFGKNGKPLWIQATYNPIPDDQGRTYKIVEFAVDITAQKELQMASDSILAEVARVMDSVASGDLSRRIDVDFPGEFAKLRTSVNTTVDRLSSVMQEIHAASSSVRDGVDEIAKGNADLSERTEQQAASLEQTSSSMTQMTETVRQNADNAGEANQLAQAASVEAEKGGEVVRRAVEAMRGISESSNKISDIIGVIDEIAFQTNLLALNASVEAARAGEQGRGFAVVASEVRNLAGRSGTAAKEIKDLIQDSGRKVEEGFRLVNESGETLDSIVNGIKQVTDIVGEISSASREQSTGVSEVNTAIVQLDELTQQNAALVEECAAASDAMGKKATELSSVVSFFQLSGVSSGSHRVEDNTARDQNRKMPPQALRLVANSNSGQGWEEF